MENRELTCIVCPVGCLLSVEEGPDAALSVSGNRCPRGAAYAQEEIRAPKRVVTATCAINGLSSEQSLHELRRIPVRTSAPCPKEKIPALLADIYAVKVTLPVKAGDILIANWNGDGIDVVASMTKLNLPGCLKHNKAR